MKLDELRNFIVPAIRTKAGKVFKGEQGDGHIHILMKHKGQISDGDETGFSDQETEFMTRDEAAKKHGIRKSEDISAKNKRVKSNLTEDAFSSQGVFLLVREIEQLLNAGNIKEALSKLALLKKLSGSVNRKQSGDDTQSFQQQPERRPVGQEDKSLPAFLRYQAN